MQSGQLRFGSHGEMRTGGDRWDKAVLMGRGLVLISKVRSEMAWQLWQRLDWRGKLGHGWVGQF